MLRAIREGALIALGFMMFWGLALVFFSAVEKVM